MRLVLWCLIAVLAVPTSSIDAAVPRPLPRTEAGCEILDAGLYVPTSQRVKFDDDSSISGERFEIEKVEFTKQTRVIPLEKHRGFGIRYRLKGLSKTAPTAITWRIVYPRAIKGKPGWERTDSWHAAASGDLVQHLLYDFAYDFEMVPGTWSFQVLVAGKPACSTTFQVRAP